VTVSVGVRTRLRRAWVVATVVLEKQPPAAV